MLFHALFSVVTASLGAAGYAQMITMAVNSTVQNDACIHEHDLFYYYSVSQLYPLRFPKISLGWRF